MSVTLDALELVKGQKFIFLNIRSLLANFALFQADFMYSRSMIIGLTETWLTANTISNLVELKGFTLCRLDRRVKKRGGGVLLYINDKYNWEELDDSLNCSDENIELLNIVINRPNQSKLCVSVCYVPPTANYDGVINLLEKVADLVSLKNMEWVLGGDFNADSGQAGGRGKKMLYSFELRNALKQLIKSPTRVCRTKKSIIDHIYVNNPDKISHSGTICYGVSDHNIVYSVIKKDCVKKQKTSFSCRNTKNYSFEQLQQNLGNIDWVDFDNCAMPAPAWDLMYKNFLSALNIVAPFVTLTRVNEKDPWVTSELLSLVRERDDLKAKSDRFIVNDNFLCFKKKRNLVKRMAINAKREFIISRLKNSDKNPKKYWNELRRVFPSDKSKDRNRPTIILNDSQGQLLPLDQVADTFNTHFSEIGTKLANCIIKDNST